MPACLTLQRFMIVSQNEVSQLAVSFQISVLISYDKTVSLLSIPSSQ